MSQDNVAIMVASHKEAVFPDDSGYFPLHVGCALGNKALPFEGDDSGFNISDKNSTFCELTGLYWLWKNTGKDVYGLVHYRRYFKSFGVSVNLNGEKIASSRDLVALLNNYDVVLSKPRNYWVESVRAHYSNAHNMIDLVALESIIKEQCEEYIPAFNEVMSRKKISLYNMFVMRSDMMNRYCEWLFDLLIPLSNKIDWESYGPYQRRVMGFLGERLLNVWVEHNIAENKVCYLPVVNIDGENKISKAKGLLMRKFGKGRLD